MTEPPPLTGATVRLLRKHRGLSQMELAELSGLSRATIQLIEQGRGPITADSELALRSVFPDLQAPRSVLEQVLGELRELKTLVGELTSGRAA